MREVRLRRRPRATRATRADVALPRAQGELEMMKGGPVYWVDCADKQPNVGSGGLAQWRLTARGRLAHSGFPHNGVNALELASEAVAFVQRRFYDVRKPLHIPAAAPSRPAAQAFPPHDLEAKYGFECSSSLKPTRINVPESSLNQVRVCPLPSCLGPLRSAA